MLRVALVGVGFMGWIHYLAYERLSSCKLAAVVTRDEKKRSGDWTGIQGNFGPPGRQIDLTGVKAYATLDEALADQEIDMVDLCLPPNLHVSSTLAALKAGKHVFCEKPLALTAADCEDLVAAANRSGKRLFVGHVLPFFPEYAFALAAARDGRFGKVIGGSFKRVISDPLWLKDFYDPRGAGGPLIDLAPSFVTACAPGATILLSGLLDSQAEAVSAAYIALGCDLVDGGGGEWRVLLLRKP